ncbi:MAG: DNA recombination protein RmuC [Actinomycetota bacterium]
MELFVLVVVAALLGGAAALLVVGRARGASLEAQRSEDLAGLRAELRAAAERFDTEAVRVAGRLEGIDSRMVETQTKSVEMTRDIFDALGDVRRLTNSVAEQARELSSFGDLLKVPKARGGIGEAMLEELLRQVLPPQAYDMQHRFSTGVVVDAIVRAGGKVVSIDSKFPLANFRRLCDATDEIERTAAERSFAADVASHIRAIATRYIVPDEDTFDFAVMYVPAEGVYAELLRLAHRKRPLFELAMEARVVPMSPLTLYGYLQTVLFGLKCLRIEESAQEILDFCGRLQGDFDRFADQYETLGRHLGNARTKYEEGRHRLDRFRDKLDHVVDLRESEEPPRLEAVVD